MNDPASMESAIRARHQVLLIIWAAQTMSLLLFALLSVFVLQSNTEDDNRLLFWVFAGVAVVLVIASSLIRNRFLVLAAKSKSPQTAQQGYIIAMALCEAAGLMGLLARVITDSPYYYTLFIMAGSAMLLNFPNRDLIAAAYAKGIS